MCLSRPLPCLPCGVWLSWPLQLLLLVCVYLVALQFKWLHARVVLLALGPGMDIKTAYNLTALFHLFMFVLLESFFSYNSSSQMDEISTWVLSHFKCSSLGSNTSFLFNFSERFCPWPFLTHAFLWCNAFGLMPSFGFSWFAIFTDYFLKLISLRCKNHKKQEIRFLESWFILLP